MFSKTAETAVFQLFSNHHRGIFIDKVKQLDDIGSAHTDATVARRFANFVFVFRAVNIDKALARVRVMLFQPVEPKNA